MLKGRNWPRQPLLALCLSGALIGVSASAMIPETRLNLARATRLRSLGRQAPDTNTDLEYRRLAFVLPTKGTVGLVLAPGDPAAAARTLYFMNYALVPRIVINTADANVLITIDEAGRRLVGTAFEPAAKVGDNIVVFRRRTR